VKMVIFTIIGAVGLILISIGIWIKKEMIQDIIFVLGGLFLLGYSIYIKNTIFIILQIVFILSAGYELFKLKFKK
jgi:hypothetical protein